MSSKITLTFNYCDVTLNLECAFSFSFLSMYLVVKLEKKIKEFILQKTN